MLEKYTPRFSYLRCVGFLLFVISTNTYSFELFEKKYDVYICGDDGKGCRKDSIQLSFKVDDKKNIVIMNFYDKGKFDSSKALEKCKVINSKNWECVNTLRSTYGSSQVVYTMSDGRLSDDSSTTKFK